MRQLVLILILILSFVSMNANAVNNKQLAFSTVKQFFNLKQPKLELKGHFVETNPDYGPSCKVNVNFSHIGKEFLTMTGEYTPVGNAGDGIYFNEDQSTFVQVELLDKRLTLEQKLLDSFSTGTTTVIKLSKNNNTLRFSIHQKSYLLFIPQIVEKTCLIENYFHQLAV